MTLKVFPALPVMLVVLGVNSIPALADNHLTIRLHP